MGHKEEVKAESRVIFVGSWPGRIHSVVSRSCTREGLYVSVRTTRTVGLGRRTASGLVGSGPGFS